MFCLLAACSELDQMRAALVVFGEIGRTNGGDGAVRGAVHQGGHITCDNYLGKHLDRCACEYAPKNGVNCVLHLDSGSEFNCPAQTQRARLRRRGWTESAPNVPDICCACV
jgi:hypothetical protein